MKYMVAVLRQEIRVEFREVEAHDADSALAEAGELRDVVPLRARELRLAPVVARDGYTDDWRRNVLRDVEFRRW